MSQIKKTPNKNDAELEVVKVVANTELVENNVKIRFNKKNKCPTFLMNLKYYFREYSGLTNLHGFKYLGEQNRSIFEKVWWIVVFVMSFWVCLYLVRRSYKKWESTPVIVTFAPNPTPVSEIPFPAVTICSQSKVQRRSYNFTHYLMKQLARNITDDERDQLMNVSLLCNDPFVDKSFGSDTIDISTLEFLRKIATSYGAAVTQCMWSNYNAPYNLFSESLTEVGFCYTFNMLNRNEIYTNVVSHNGDYLNHSMNASGWSIENGYSYREENDTDLYPRRTTTAGAKAGLSITLFTTDEDYDLACANLIEGFKLILHNPMEVPRANTHFIRISLNQDAIVTIKPDMVITSSNLRPYEPHRRMCFFESEKQLWYFRNYTKGNCEIECLTNFTFLHCDCVGFHMPRTEDMAICGPGKLKCMQEADLELMSSQVHSREFLKHCDCLPGCTTISYSAQTSQSALKWKYMMNVFYNLNLTEVVGYQATRITLFYKDSQFIFIHRDEQYGTAEFLSSCIALLDLFVGFSLVSCIEIIYFLTLRLFCNIIKYGRHHWSGLRAFTSKSN